jgi:hypothetical protein
MSEGTIKTAGMPGDKPVVEQPEKDDVFVRERRGHPGAEYVIGTPCAPAGLVLKSRNEAISQAVEFARTAHVRAWMENSRDQPVLLGSFRLREQVGIQDEGQAARDRRPKRR